MSSPTPLPRFAIARLRDGKKLRGAQVHFYKAKITERATRNKPPNSAPTVGKETPASGSSTGVGVGVGVVPGGGGGEVGVGVAVGPGVGVAVGPGVGVAVGPGVGVAVGPGVGVPVGPGVGVGTLNSKTQGSSETGTGVGVGVGVTSTALGTEAGAVGATGSVPASYNFQAVPRAMMAKTTVINPTDNKDKFFFKNSITQPFPIAYTDCRQHSYKLDIRFDNSLFGERCKKLFLHIRRLF